MRDSKGHFLKGDKTNLGRKRPDVSALMSKLKIGNKNRVGKKHTEETKEKISKAKIGNIPGNKGIKGVFKHSIETRRIIGLKNSGEKSHLWKGGISQHYKERYFSLEYKLWREAVFKRDNFTCQDCGSYGEYITAHHIKSWKNYPELRFEVSNGRTLCEKCHEKTDNYKGRAKSNKNL